MRKKYEPQNKYIFVGLLEDEKEQNEGIIITTNTKKAYKKAVVYAVAKDCELDLKEGDEVIYSGYGNVIDLGNDLALIKATDILAICN